MTLSSCEGLHIKDQNSTDEDGSIQIVESVPLNGFPSRILISAIAAVVKAEGPVPVRTSSKSRVISEMGLPSFLAISLSQFKIQSTKRIMRGFPGLHMNVHWQNDLDFCLRIGCEANSGWSTSIPMTISNSDSSKRFGTHRDL